jgi:hypothetical protein
MQAVAVVAILVVDLHLDHVGSLLEVLGRKVDHVFAE